MRICDYIYGVFENGVLIFQGNRDQIANRYNLSPQSVYQYPRRHMKIRNRYDVRVMNGKFEKKYCQPPVMTIHQKRLEHLATHLKIYDNCATAYDPVPYFPDLLDMGINCRCREMEDTDGLWYLTESVKGNG